MKVLLYYLYYYIIRSISYGRGKHQLWDKLGIRNGKLI
nr:MAG TPA: hypothetical protein [Caudoviricetes sp.]DAW52096.1 MAG TPA: hypothetical protein [Caudoviricetes sp.]